MSFVIPVTVRGRGQGQNMWEVEEELLAVNFVTVDIWDCLISGFFSYIFVILYKTSEFMSNSNLRSTFAWIFYVAKEKRRHIGILAFSNLFF